MADDRTADDRTPTAAQVEELGDGRFGNPCGLPSRVSSSAGARS